MNFLHHHLSLYIYSLYKFPTSSLDLYIQTQVMMSESQQRARCPKIGQSINK